MPKTVTTRVSLLIKERWEQLYKTKYKSTFALESSKTNIKQDFSSPVGLTTLYKMFRTEASKNPPRRSNYIAVCKWLGIDINTHLHIIDLLERDKGTNALES